MDLQTWLPRLAAGLDAEDVVLDEETVRLLLDLTREAAHDVERVAGPLTTFLVGVAVGRGRPVTAAVDTAHALLETPSSGSPD